MKEIDLNEALKTLMNRQPGLYADFDFSDDIIASMSSAYHCSDAIAIKTLNWNQTQFIWYLCDIGNCNMELSLTTLNAHDPENLDKILIYAKAVDGVHCLVFSCTGKPYEDACIRLLEEKDSEQLLALTTIYDDNNPFSQSIAENIQNQYFHLKEDAALHMLGIFEGATLAGAISIENKHNKVIVIRDVFVAKEYRGKKYATRLIRAALALYIDAPYSYSCGSDNPASSAAAKAAGFAFEGTYVFL